MGKKSIQYLPEVVLIGADPNDDREDIKREILKRVNEKKQRVRKESIEIQLRGFRFPAQMNDPRQKMAMMVMVHRFWYVEVTKELLECGKIEVSKHDFPVTYDVKMEDIRLIKEGVEERYKNAYLSQVQY